MGGRHAVWQYFEETEPRANSKSHPKAKCIYCGEKVRGQPKSFMIPHLRKCSAAPSSVTQQWQVESMALTIVTPLSASSSVSEASLDMGSDHSELAAEGLELVPHTPQRMPGPAQLQQLELLRLKARVAQCQAKAAEARFTAERFAARIKLQSLGVPDNEIDANLPSL
ncbi:hypothetical protein PF005_g16800 [Phytophthora fragariae]|uniref:BED-type domain-containing protein n=1 Tax=Phytophthora fragariae TaxID=53985 RepID=A0A6A4CWL1_9STRA|nr:hypothetical protein PF003_g31018 [Phytophthora fragariae]KAE8930447.1 hypothetical protein PF009_g19465 [Phytophthora fragariae]KAE8996904.1 hypothetical protein PF011_g15710 [Phytophthora fragariae]KAE9091121.1 hypothetical protein PF010_g18315 [Phytophthora fragariae]KAE9092190.1 hypothetical protein PF007_g18609 [Phytophthora fragariae]